MTDFAKDFSSSLAAAVEKAGRSVVNIDARRWPTSGLVFNADGVVIAAHHAIEREEGIALTLSDGRTVPATLVGRDPTLDLAVLKTDVKPASPEWVDASTLKVGQLVLGLYRPDKSVRARWGIVEGVGEGFHTPWGGRVDTDIDVDLSTRNLSAATFADVEGRIVGFHVSGGRGHGLTLPAATLQRVVGQILQHGRVRRGYLGIGSQPVRTPNVKGLLVVGVEPGSPADKAGLALGDVVVSVDGATVTDVQDLYGALAEEKIGHAVPLRILRTGRATDVNITVGQRP